jgi:transcriptional regulator with XRE-family HTH domain
MDDLALVRVELDKLEYKDLPALADATGVPAGTIAKIKCNVTKNPRYDTVAPLAGYFRRVIAAREAAAQAV